MLGVENRGYLALLILWPAILSRLAGIGLPIAVPYFLARDSTVAGQVLRTILRPSLMQVAGMLVVHASILLALLPGKPHPVQIAGISTLVLVPSSLSLEYGLAFLQGQQRYTAFNVLRATQPTLYAVAVAILFFFGRHDIISVTLVLLGSAIFASLATIVVVARGLPRSKVSRGDGPSLRELFHFGLKGFIGAVSPVETFRLDQAVIGLLLSPTALGLYVVALAFTNLPRFIAMSMGTIAYPQIAAQKGAVARRSQIVNYFLVTMLLATPVVMVLILGADRIVPFFFGRRFAGAIDLTRILLLGALFYAARRVLTDSSRGAGAPGVGTIAEIASWIWLAVALPLTVPRLGVIGVAFAITSSSLVGLLTLVYALMRSRALSASNSVDWISAPPQRVLGGGSTK
jgi:O-antigen/teichoic acid export membrane protein